MPRPNATALAKLTPTSSAPTRPGAFVTATASIASSDVSASASARVTTGTIAVRCCRDAISGTTPPNTRWTSCERMTSDRIVTSSPEPSITDADVSSHDVSIPRMRVTRRASRSRLDGRVGGRRRHAAPLHLHLRRLHLHADPRRIQIRYVRHRVVQRDGERMRMDLAHRADDATWPGDAHDLRLERDVAAGRRGAVGAHDDTAIVDDRHATR